MSYAPGARRTHLAAIYVLEAADRLRYVQSDQWVGGHDAKLVFRVRALVDRYRLPHLQEHGAIFGSSENACIAEPSLMAH